MNPQYDITLYTSLGPIQFHAMDEDFMRLVRDQNMQPDREYVVVNMPDPDGRGDMDLILNKEHIVRMDIVKLSQEEG